MSIQEASAASSSDLDALVERPAEIPCDWDTSIYYPSTDTDDNLIYNTQTQQAQRQMKLPLLETSHARKSKVAVEPDMDDRWAPGKWVTVNCADADGAPFWVGKITAKPFMAGDDSDWQVNVHWYEPGPGQNYSHWLSPCTVNKKPHIDTIELEAVLANFSPSTCRQGRDRIKVPRSLLNEPATSSDSESESDGSDD